MDRPRIYETIKISNICIPEGEDEEQCWKSIGNNNAQNLKVWERHETIDSRSWANPNKMSPKKAISGPAISCWKPMTEKNCKSSLRKNDTLSRKEEQLTTDFSLRDPGFWKEAFFKVLKEKNCQPRILCSARIQNWRENNRILSQHTCSERIAKDLQNEGKWY